MDGCASMAQWTNMYHQQGGIESSRSISMILDPIHEEFHQEENGQGGISWGGEGAPRDHMCSSLGMMSPLSGLMHNNIVQPRLFDASINKGTSSANSIDQQSLECLLSGTNSNTDTSVEDDDGISMIFSDCRNFLNFSSNHPTNNNNNNNNSDNGHIKKRATMESDNQGDHQEFPAFSITQENSSCLNSRASKRQRIINNVNKFGQGRLTGSSNISFQQGSSSGSSVEEPDAEAIQQMKEMIYRAAAFRPVNFGVDMVERPKRKNVRISCDPQTVAARQRRERISERLRVLQKLVPGGSKMDTASMLDEAANYLKFLRNQVKALETLGNNKVVDNYQFSPNNNPTTNHLFPPFNLQFSPIPFATQPTNFTPQFSLQNPNQNLHVLPKI